MARSGRAGRSVSITRVDISQEAVFRIFDSEAFELYMRQMAEEIANDASRRAIAQDLYVTGTLARGIEWEIVHKTFGPQAIIFWTDEAWYGWLQEIGTSKYPPRPHLRPALYKRRTIQMPGVGPIR